MYSCSSIPALACTDDCVVSDWVSESAMCLDRYCSDIGLWMLVTNSPTLRAPSDKSADLDSALSDATAGDDSLLSERGLKVDPLLGSGKWIASIAASSRAGVGELPIWSDMGAVLSGADVDAGESRFSAVAAAA